MAGEDYPRTMMEMERRFSSDEACRLYLARLRWPGGFECPRCHAPSGWATSRGLWVCAACRAQTSVVAGTVLQDSKLPLTAWLRAMWHVTSQKNGISALGLQRVLGLGSYKTAWSLLHKLRRAMVRPGRDRLSGAVEVDETYWGTEETGVIGRLTHEKTLIAVAAEARGAGLGRVRLRCIPDLTRPTLHGFIREVIEPQSTVMTDGLSAYLELVDYRHVQFVQRRQAVGVFVMPRVHRVVSLLKRWLLGTHQGAISPEHLNEYLDEFTFRFNRRTSASRGKLFYRLAQQAMQIGPVPYDRIVGHEM